MNYKKELEKMRKKYARRPFDFVLPLPPNWLTKDDPIYSIYNEQKELFDKGVVYYASLIQANELLFRSDNNHNCPALFLLSPDESINENPMKLKILASKLFSYKGRNPENVPEEWRQIAADITDEMSRDTYSFRITNDQGKPADVYYITNMVFREHLPKNTLLSMLVPVIAMPGKCRSIIILPQMFWTRSFKNAWIKNRF